jgi:hypothetical protein
MNKISNAQQNHHEARRGGAGGDCGQHCGRDRQLKCWPRLALASISKLTY